MEETLLFVKANVGNRHEYVKIISHEKLSDYEIAMLKDMTLDRARDYAKIKKWTLIIINQ